MCANTQHAFFIRPSADGHVRHCDVSAVVDHTALDMGVHVSLGDHGKLFFPGLGLYLYLFSLMWKLLVPDINIITY